jgi:hypothetical protein
MTEADWLASGCSYQMFQFIRCTADRRKLRLFACSGCRRIWNLLSDRRSRIAVEVSERYADGWATKEELSAAQSEAAKAVRVAVETCKPLEAEAIKGFKNLSGADAQDAWSRYCASSRRRAAAKAVKAVARSTDKAARMAEEMSQAVGWARADISQTHLYRAQLMRCVFGNPFRTQHLAAEHATRDVVRLADAIYHDRAYEHLPVLGEALEDAGCNNVDILAHCRGVGPHTRGCWVLDLIL